MHSLSLCYKKKKSNKMWGIKSQEETLANFKISLFFFLDTFELHKIITKMWCLPLYILPISYKLTELWTKSSHKIRNLQNVFYGKWCHFYSAFIFKVWVHTSASIPIPANSFAASKQCPTYLEWETKVICFPVKKKKMQDSVQFLMFII